MEVLQLQDKEGKTIFVRMTEHEALATIESMTRQIRTKNPNYERFESYTDNGEYFSIAVIP